MGWLNKIFGAGIKETAGAIGDVVNKFSEQHLSKRERDLEIERLLAAQAKTAAEAASAVIESKQKIMVAELEHGDKFTKRARPSIVYTGLLAAVIDGIGGIDFTMSPDFWYVWGGVCGIYAIGRTAEKRGWGGKVTKAVTGGTMKSILED